MEIHTKTVRRVLIYLISINNNDYVSVTYDNTDGTTPHYSNFMRRKTAQIQPSTNYLIVVEIVSVQGTGRLQPWTKHAFSCINNSNPQLYFNNLTAGQKIFMPVTTKSEFDANTIYDLRTLIIFEAGQSGSITFRLSLLTDTTITSDTFEYEPYTNGASPNPDYPQKIASCGDRTKNLLNVSNEYSVTTWQEIDINLQPGDYIVNCTNTSTNVEAGNTSLMNFYHSDNTYDQLYFSRVDKVGTITITAETTKVRIYSGSSYSASNGKTTILTNLMIRKSNISDGTYEPYGYKIPVNVNNVITNIYLDEPLRKIGDYSDYIDFKNGKVVRNIKEVVLNGSEDWYTSSGTSQVAFNKGVGYIHDTTKLPCNISSNCQMPNNNLYFYSTGYSLADWKTILSTTNAIVCGRLATPIEEPITLPNIPTIKGNNILNIETEIAPSQVYIKYRSDN